MESNGEKKISGVGFKKINNGVGDFFSTCKETWMTKQLHSLNSCQTPGGA